MSKNTYRSQYEVGKKDDNKQVFLLNTLSQGCISCGTCSYPELTEDHVLTRAYVKIFRIVTRNAVNKSFWRKKDCSWPPSNKYAMNIWLSSLRIRAHLSWRTGKHLHVLHVLHVLRTYSTCSYPGYQDTTTYAALLGFLTCSKHWSQIQLEFNWRTSVDLVTCTKTSIINQIKSNRIQSPV